MVSGRCRLVGILKRRQKVLASEKNNKVRPLLADFLTQTKIGVHCCFFLSSV